MSGFGPTPLPPSPIERDLVRERQDDIARELPGGQRAEQAERAEDRRKGAPRRWLRFLRRG